MIYRVLVLIQTTTGKTFHKIEQYIAKENYQQTLSLIICWCCKLATLQAKTQGCSTHFILSDSECKRERKSKNNFSRNKATILVFMDAELFLSKEKYFVMLKLLHLKKRKARPQKCLVKFHN